MTRGPRQGGNARLSDDNVRTIRTRYAEGATQRELCQAYGVSITTIGRIVRGETWGWLDGQGHAPEEPKPAPMPQATPEELAASAERLRTILENENDPQPAGEGNSPPESQS